MAVAKTNPRRQADATLVERIFAGLIAVVAMVLGLQAVGYFGWASFYWLRQSPPNYLAAAVLGLVAVLIVLAPVSTWLFARRRGMLPRRSGMCTCLVLAVAAFVPMVVVSVATAGLA